MPNSLFCQLTPGLRPKCFFSSYGLARHYDWTKRCQEIAGDAWHVKAGSAIIDGDVVAFCQWRHGSCGLQNELKGKSTKLVPVAFDLFYLNGQDLRRLPLTIRKAGLEKIITGPIFSSAKALPSAAARYLRMCRLGLDGRRLESVESVRIVALA